MIILLGIVIGAVALMLIVGRRPTPEIGQPVADVSSSGLQLDIGDGDRLVAWSSIFEVAVLTRRELGRTWFGFELLTETHGSLRIDGSSGPGEAFLAEAHRLPGFDHDALMEALTTRQSRIVCFSR